MKNESDYGFSVLINKKTKLLKIFMVSTKYFKFLLMMENIKRHKIVVQLYGPISLLRKKKTSDGSGTLILGKPLKFC